MKTKYFGVIITLQAPPASPSSAELLVSMSKVTKDDSWATYGELPGSSTYSNATLSNLAQMSIQKQRN